MEGKVPVDTEVVLLPEFDQELKEFNLRLGKNIKAEGGKALYIKGNSTKSYVKN